MKLRESCCCLIAKRLLADFTHILPFPSHVSNRTPGDFLTLLEFKSGTTTRQHFLHHASRYWSLTLKFIGAGFASLPDVTLVQLEEFTATTQVVGSPT